jgi:hypothetical protein
MDEIGYKDCDNVSIEQPWTFWVDRFHFDYGLFQLHVAHVVNRLTI